MSTVADTVLGVCEHILQHRITGETRGCNTPAVARIRAGCVHEHMSAGLACQHHLTELLEGRAVCRRCLAGADGHRCAVLGKEVPA